MTEKWDDLLGSDQVRLTRNELLLMDWSLCTGSGMMAPLVLDLLDWHRLRMEIWKAMPEPDAPLPAKPSLGVMFAMEETTAKLLLCAIPTSYEWGDGADCGFSLKVKLNDFLWGTYSDPQPARDEEDRKEAANAANDNSGETQDKAPGPTTTSSGD